jgi:hypothetical protein
LDFVRDGGHGGSDHSSFMRAGCPSVAFWSRGDHPFYHHWEDDARWTSDSAFSAVGNRAEDFVRFLGNYDGALAAHADTLRLIARKSICLDLDGRTLEAQTSLPALSAITAMWISHDGAMTAAESFRRISDLRGLCDAKKISFSDLKDDLRAYRKQQDAVFAGMDEADLPAKRPSDISTLKLAGLSVLRLTSGAVSKIRTGVSEVLTSAKQTGLLAIIPFDFNTPSRVDFWGKQGVVHGDLKDFASAPASVREGLLSSDAMLIFEIPDTPNTDQIQSIRSGVARRVHLNFGSIPDYRREEHVKAIVKSLFDAGLNQQEILLLTGGNLRRFFES